MKKFSLLLLVFGFIGSAFAENEMVDVSFKKNENQEEFSLRLEKKYDAIDSSVFKDSINHARMSYLKGIPPYDVYEDSQLAGISENMLYLQNADGGWAKNYDWLRKYSLEELQTLREKNKANKPLTYDVKSSGKMSSMDNRNGYAQIEYLSKVYKQIKDKRYIDCIVRALDLIISVQHPESGGWTGSDVFAITYNDDLMSGVLRTFRDISRNDDLYGFLPKETREKCAEAYNRGIKCILDTQIKTTVDGKEVLTAWCQQHDHKTLKPIWARAFEPPSITSQESMRVVQLLMEDENPTEEIKNSIVSAMEFFNRDDIRIHGVKRVLVDAPHDPTSKKYPDSEYVLQEDKDAPDLWARFYDIETLKPIYCDRERKFVKTYNELSRERRNGYHYINNWPEKYFPVFEAWKEKHLK